MKQLSVLLLLLLVVVKQCESQLSYVGRLHILFENNSPNNSYVKQIEFYHRSGRRANFKDNTMEYLQHDYIADFCSIPVPNSYKNVDAPGADPLPYGLRKTRLADPIDTVVFRREGVSCSSDSGDKPRFNIAARYSYFELNGDATLGDTVPLLDVNELTPVREEYIGLSSRNQLVDARNFTSVGMYGDARLKEVAAYDQDGLPISIEGSRDTKLSGAGAAHISDGIIPADDCGGKPYNTHEHGAGSGGYTGRMMHGDRVVSRIEFYFGISSCQDAYTPQMFINWALVGQSEQVENVNYVAGRHCFFDEVIQITHRDIYAFNLHPLRVYNNVYDRPVSIRGIMLLNRFGEVCNQAQILWPEQSGTTWIKEYALDGKFDYSTCGTSGTTCSKSGPNSYNNFWEAKVVEVDNTLVKSTLQNSTVTYDEATRVEKIVVYFPIEDVANSIDVLLYKHKKVLLSTQSPFANYNETEASFTINVQESERYECIEFEDSCKVWASTSTHCQVGDIGHVLAEHEVKIQEIVDIAKNDPLDDELTTQLYELVSCTTQLLQSSETQQSRIAGSVAKLARYISLVVSDANASGKVLEGAVQVSLDFLSAALTRSRVVPYAHDHHKKLPIYSMERVIPIPETFPKNSLTVPAVSYWQTVTDTVDSILVPSFDGIDGDECYSVFDEVKSLITTEEQVIVTNLEQIQNAIIESSTRLQVRFESENWLGINSIERFQDILNQLKLVKTKHSDPFVNVSTDFLQLDVLQALLQKLVQRVATLSKGSSSVLKTMLHEVAKLSPMQYLIGHMVGEYDELELTLKVAQGKLREAIQEAVTWLNINSIDKDPIEGGLRTTTFLEFRYIKALGDLGVSVQFAEFATNYELFQNHSHSLTGTVLRDFAHLANILIDDGSDPSLESSSITGTNGQNGWQGVYDSMIAMLENLSVCETTQDNASERRLLISTKTVSSSTLEYRQQGNRVEASSLRRTLAEKTSSDKANANKAVQKLQPLCNAFKLEFQKLVNAGAVLQSEMIALSDLLEEYHKMSYSLIARRLIRSQWLERRKMCLGEGAQVRHALKLQRSLTTMFNIELRSQAIDNLLSVCHTIQYVLNPDTNVCDEMEIVDLPTVKDVHSYHQKLLDQFRSDWNAHFTTQLEVQTIDVTPLLQLNTVRELTKDDIMTFSITQDFMKQQLDTDLRCGYDMEVVDAVVLFVGIPETTHQTRLDLSGTFIKTNVAGETTFFTPIRRSYMERSYDVKSSSSQCLPGFNGYTKVCGKHVCVDQGDAFETLKAENNYIYPSLLSTYTIQVLGLSDRNLNGVSEVRLVVKGRWRMSGGEDCEATERPCSWYTAADKDTILIIVASCSIAFVLLLVGMLAHSRYVARHAVRTDLEIATVVPSRYGYGGGGGAYGTLPEGEVTNKDPP